MNHPEIDKEIDAELSQFNLFVILHHNSSTPPESTLMIHLLILQPFVTIAF